MWYTWKMRIRSIKSWKDPFNHYTFSGFFSPNELAEYKAVDPHGLGGNQLTQTRTSSKQRIFIDDELCKQYKIYAKIRSFFSSEDTIGLFESYIGERAPEYLRMEIIKDVGESWLEPHCDIKEKYMSLLIFINDSCEDETLGTDLYSTNLEVKKTVPFIDNTGYFFYPGDNTWHGLERRKIKTHRKILMVNYVTFKTEIQLSRVLR